MRPSDSESSQSICFKEMKSWGIWSTAQTSSLQGIPHPKSTGSEPLEVHRLSSFFFNIFYWLCYYSCPIYHRPPFIPLHPAHTLPPTFSPFSSCPWVVHITSLASTFPILFLTPLSIFYLPFMLLIPCTFPPPPPPPLLITLHVISISVVLFLV